MFGLQRFYYISAGLWLVTIMLLVAGISVKEREKKEASEINKT
jgi:preprotein translocase subunit SecG